MLMSTDLYIALTNYDIKQFSYLMPELYNILKHSPRDRILSDLKSGRITVDERMTVLTTALYLRDDDRLDYLHEKKRVLALLLKDIDFDLYSSFMEIRNTALTIVKEDQYGFVRDLPVPCSFSLDDPITPIQKEVSGSAKEVFKNLPDVGVFCGITFVKEDADLTEVKFKGACPISLYPGYHFDYSATGLRITELNMQMLNLNLAQQITPLTTESLQSAQADYVLVNEGVLSNAVNLLKSDGVKSLIARTFSST